MNQSVQNKSISFIWSIADDYLRDVYIRGKYRDVILSMVVLRRLYALSHHKVSICIGGSKSTCSRSLD